MPEAFLLQLRLRGFVRDNISTDPLPLTMAALTDTGEARANLSVGHVSVHVEGAHPVEVPFLLEMQERRLGPAFAASLASHVVMVVIAFLLVRYGSQLSRNTPFLPELPNNQII